MADGSGRVGRGGAVGRGGDGATTARRGLDAEQGRGVMVAGVGWEAPVAGQCRRPQLIAAAEA